jgi:O-antigen/teichoic acid export membrane protein
MRDAEAGLGLKIAIGSGTLVLIRAIDLAVGIVSVTILARMLAPEAFGLVALGATLVGLVEIFAELGLDIGLIRDRDADRADYDTAWTLQVLVGIGVAAILILLARPGAIFFRDPRVEMIVYALAVSKIVASFANIRIIDFRRDLEFNREFRFMVTVRLVSAALTILWAVIWRSHWALLAGIFTRSATSLILSYILAPYRPRFTLARLAKIMGFSRWLLLRGLLIGVNERVTNLMLGRLVSVESLAFYNLANEVNGTVITGLHAPVRRALYPGYARISDDRTKLSLAYVEVFSVLVLVGLPLVLGIGLLGPQIVLLFLGEKWAPAGPLLQVLCIAGIFRCFNTSGGLVYLVTGRPHVATGMAFFRLCALVPALYFFTKHYGVNGAAWAVTALAGVFLIVETTVETRFLGVSFKQLVAVSWRTVAAGVVMAAAVNLVQRIYLPDGGLIGMATAIALMAAAGATIYISTVLALWVVVGRPKGPEAKVLDLATQFRLSLAR